VRFVDCPFGAGRFGAPMVVEDHGRVPRLPGRRWDGGRRLRISMRRKKTIRSVGVEELDTRADAHRAPITCPPTVRPPRLQITVGGGSAVFREPGVFRWSCEIPDCSGRTPRQTAAGEIKLKPGTRCGHFSKLGRGRQLVFAAPPSPSARIGHAGRRRPKAPCLRR